MSLSEMLVAKNLNSYPTFKKNTLFDKSLFHKYYSMLDISIEKVHCEISKDLNHSYDVLEMCTPFFQHSINPGGKVMEKS